MHLRVGQHPEVASVPADAAHLEATERRVVVALSRVDADIATAQVPCGAIRAIAVSGEDVVVEPEVRAVGDGDALVVVGALKLTVSRKSLVRSEQAESIEAVGTWTGDLPEVHVPTEIDLRGMRPDEAEAAVLQALDAAVRADLRSLRIIHGKGTGALRDRVGEMLRKDTRVKTFRLGAWNEGGAGVTIAEFA